MASCLVLHAWWGLGADVRAYADRLRRHGFDVATPDLYGGGQVATTIPEAKALMKNRDRDGLIHRIDDAVRGLGPGPLGVVGWSMGAMYALDFVERQPQAARAVVTYYGSPEFDVKAPLPPILAHFAEFDTDDQGGWVPVIEDVRKAEQTMRAAGKALDSQVYPGTKHWFDEPSRPEYDRAASELAWTRTLAFLHRELRGSGPTRTAAR